MFRKVYVIFSTLFKRISGKISLFIVGEAILCDICGKAYIHYTFMITVLPASIVPVFRVALSPKLS